MKIRPLYDRVVVKAPEPEEKTKGGLYIPQSAAQENRGFLRGVVVAVGPGRLDEKGNLVPMQCKVGETVIFGQYSCTQVGLGDQTDMKELYAVVKDGDVLGVLEEDPPMTVEALLGEDLQAGQ